MNYDITQRIQNAIGTFSKGQKRIAAVILENYDKAAYMTASRLGELANVSESTVVRFAGQLGYDGYPELQRAVQELVRIKLTPNQRIAVTNQRIGEGNVLESVLQSDIDKIKYTLDNTDRRAFENAVNLLLKARTIYIMGVRSSATLASFLAFNFHLIFDNVRFVETSSTSEVFEQILQIGPEDVFFAMTFPRYSKKILKAATYARNQGAAVIGLTDSSVSPLAEFSTCLLTAQSDMASFVDSLVAPLSIINAIIVAVTREKESEVSARFDRLEHLWDEYDVYDKH